MVFTARFLTGDGRVVEDELEARSRFRASH